MKSLTSRTTPIASLGYFGYYGVEITKVTYTFTDGFRWGDCGPGVGSNELE